MEFVTVLICFYGVSYKLVHYKWYSCNTMNSGITGVSNAP